MQQYEDPTPSSLQVLLLQEISAPLLMTMMLLLYHLSGSGMLPTVTDYFSRTYREYYYLQRSSRKRDFTAYLLRYDDRI